MSTWFVLVRGLSKFLLVISGITLAIMFLFTLTDVIMRLFGKPIVGDFEIISFLGAVVIGFAIPYTSLTRGNIRVDFLLTSVPAKVRHGFEIFTRALGIALFIWISWNFVLMGLDLIETNTVTPVFRMPYYPISFGLAFCCVVQCFTFISQILEIVGGSNG